MREILTTEPAWELPTATIRHLLEGVAPERVAEIRRVFHDHQPRLFVDPLARQYGGFCAREDMNAILLAPNSRDALWMISFAAWLAFRAHVPKEYLATSLPAGPMRDDVLSSSDEGYQTEAIASRRLGSLAINLLKNPVPPGTLWPDGVPLPTDVINAQERADPALPLEHAAVKDLALFAIAYILLHELRHIIFNSGREDVSSRQEEMACDQFAVDMILGHAADWQPQDGSHPEASKVIFKRSMGLLVGFFALHRFTPPGARSAQQDYPALTTRLQTILNAVSLPDDHPMWTFGATLMRELQDNPEANPSTQSTETPKSHFLSLVERGFQ